MKNKTARNRSTYIALIAFAFVLLLSVKGQADVVLSQPPLDRGTSYGATSNSQLSTRLNLSQEAKITSLRWWGGPASGSLQPDVFYIRFFKDTGELMPETDPFSDQIARIVTITPTGLSAWPGQPIFEYEADLQDPIILHGDAYYYLSILAVSYNEPLSWGWAASTLQAWPTPESWSRSSDRDNWTEVPRAKPAFELIQGAEVLPIINSYVPVNSGSRYWLSDGGVDSFWVNDGDLSNAWFDVELVAHSEIKQLKLVPREKRIYTFNVYVDGAFVASYTTASATTVAPQAFELPPGTVGTVVRVELVSAQLASGRPTGWFKVFEVTLLGERLSGRVLPIVGANVPVKSTIKGNLFDGDLTTFWNNDGDQTNTWFEVRLDARSEINQLKLAPRVDTPYPFDVYVDDVFVARYTTTRSATVAPQTFDLPPGTVGTVVRVTLARLRWFKVYEVELLGVPLAESVLPIVGAEVPVKSANKGKLFDGDLTTFWNNDGDLVNAWFELLLDARSEINQLKLAPRDRRVYAFNVYVDGDFVAHYTTASATEVELQTFTLPTDTVGTVVRVQLVSGQLAGGRLTPWFKVFEVRLSGVPLSESVLPIVDAEVPVKSANKGNLFDGDLTTFWNNDGQAANAWFEVRLGVRSEIKQLKLAPRENTRYVFNVYVDGEYVARRSTRSYSSAVLQTIELSPSAFGTVVRVELVSKNWFKVHEIELVGR